MDFLMVLLFSKTVLLTPVPIMIGPSCIELTFQSPVEVLNGGAVLLLESPSKPDQGWFDEIRHAYPPGTIVAALHRKDAPDVVVENRSHEIGTDTYALALYPAEHFKKGDRFVGARICALQSVKAARVYWRNASK